MKYEEKQTSKKDDALTDVEERYNTIVALPNCNTCGIKGLCKFCVHPGQVVRLNCPLWVQSKGEMHE